MQEQNVMMLPIDALIPDPSQPRQTFPEQEIDRLAASISARGILLPLRVLYDKERSCYRIINGECRWRAAKRAMLSHVPCLPVTGELSEEEILAEQIIENCVRHELDPLQEARALSRLKAIKGCNSKALVEEYGFSGASITKAESLLSLPADVQEMIGSGAGQIAPATGYEISRLPDEASQRELAHAVIARHMPRDAVADAVRARIGKRNVAPKQGRVSCELDGGISITVSSGEPLTWDGLLSALDYLKRQAKKLADEGGKEVSALSRLRAS